MISLLVFDDCVGLDNYESDSQQPLAAMSNGSSGAVLYSVVLRPHRSLGVKAIRQVMLIVAFVWLVVGMVFVIAGAWPVMPFLGLEVVLLYGALMLNHRAGDVFEAINLTEKALTVRRVNPWGKQSDFSFQPDWLQVNIDDPPTPTSRLELRSHGKSLIIGSFLLPGERLELARSLRRELDRLTRTRLKP